MITPEYCVAMARYNAWQNRQIKGFVEPFSTEALNEDRGAFFGSILGTLNHLLWGDRMWMSRLAGQEAPPPWSDACLALTASSEEWALERFRTDSAILQWAESLHAIDLTGNLHWYSGLADAEMEAPVGHCVAHMFNHQTHHRGQVHAMLTAAGSKAPVSDLAFMPKDGPWL